jgi:hypothetical protein
MARFFADTIKFHAASMATAVTLRHVSGFAHDIGMNLSNPESGAYNNEATFIASQQPRITFTTIALESMLKTVGLLDGLCVEDDTGKPGFQLFGQEHSVCTVGARASGSTNMSITAVKAHALIRSISANVGQDATVSMEVFCLSDDGANPPTATVYNAALPTGAVIDEAFTVGPIQLDGITIPNESIQSVTVDTGIEANVIQAAASIYPTAVVRAKAAPTVTIVLDDASFMSASGVPFGGLKVESPESFVSFVKRTAYGGLAALTASEHTKISINGFARVTDHASGGGSSPLGATIVIQCNRIGANAPLVVANDTALAE